jgi:hypothetical protein
MLYFRSEEHVDRWCKQWNQPRGESFSLETAFALAKGFFGDRLQIRRKKTVEETRALFDSLGFTSDFWKLA